MSKPITGVVRVVERFRHHDDDRECACGQRVTLHHECCGSCSHKDILVKCPHCGRAYSYEGFGELPRMTRSD